MSPLRALIPLEGGFGPLAPHHPSEIIVGVVLLLIIFLVMWKKVVPAFEKTYAKRVELIQGGIERADRAQQEAEEMRRDFEARLASAREDAARIREEAKTQSAQVMAEARASAAAESERMLATASAQIEAARAAAALQLRAEIGGLATELASRIVGEALDDDARAQRTVDRFLAELEASERAKT